MGLLHSQLMRGLRHVAALASLALLTLLFTRPLVAHLTTGIIGAGAGDNVAALWNVWWARTALGGPSSLFETPALFAPFGVNLALHSFAPLVAGATALLPATPLTAYNIALLVSVWLNGGCAYAAAWGLTRGHLASLFAGVAFGGAPFLLVRLQGHLNVLSAWALPLLLVAVRQFEKRRDGRSAVLVGVLVAIQAYLDEYYAIFGVGLVLVYLACSRWTIESRALTLARRRALAGLGLTAAVAGAAIAWIAATGGVDTTLAGIRLRMNDTFDGRVVLGSALLAAWLVWKHPTIQIETSIEAGRPNRWTRLAVSAAVAAVLLSPLLLAVWRLWLAGDYESQFYFWRSAPPGVDLGAFLLGNPYGAITGRGTTSAFAWLGIDQVESAVWTGVAPLALASVAAFRLRSDRNVRALLWIGGLFLLWSFGPYLRILGYNTAFMLPQTLARYVPLLSNARIPGRAFVIVQLAIAMLAAKALASFDGSSRRTLIGGAALAILVADFTPAARAWTPLDRTPTVYDSLRVQPPGIVLELPLGMRDGFGERGRLNHRVLFYQTVHGHPLMGGFVARLSSRIKTAYNTDPVIGRLLDLSESPPPVPPALPALSERQRVEGPASVAACGLACVVKYVIIDEADSSAELRQFAAAVFELRPIESGDARTLYVVERVRRN